MFFAKIPNRSSPPCYLLRESRRVDGKVTTTTLANLRSLSQNQIAAIQAALKGEDLAPSRACSRSTGACRTAMWRRSSKH